MRRSRLVVGISGILLAAACTSGSVGRPVPPSSASATPSTSPSAPAVVAGDIHKIKHVIVIMQENRSFDTYFGTFPGADGYR